VITKFFRRRTIQSYDNGYYTTHRFYTDLRQVDNPFIGPHSVPMAARQGMLA